MEKGLQNRRVKNMHETKEILNRKCSVCETNWERKYFWSEIFPSDTTDTLQVREYCPNGCEKGFVFIDGPETAFSPKNIDKIKDYLKENGYELSE